MIQSPWISVNCELFGSQEESELLASTNKNTKKFGVIQTGVIVRVRNIL